MGMARIQGLFFPAVHLLASGVNLIIIYWGGKAVIGDELSLGTIVAFLAYLQMMFWPMFAMGWVVSLYQRGKASMERINRILATEPNIRNLIASPHSDRMIGRIEINDLRFAYEGKPVLDGITLSIEPGQTVGLMGLTGAGKTTFLSLIARLYPLERGMITIDGVDLNDWDLGSLRQQIGFATQEPFLFSQTIAENIHFGSSDTDQDQMATAAEAAALDKDVPSFPYGYDTMVGERGITLSGGQKQRTAIARALVIDPAILILDDATSSVDTETEHEIHSRVHRANADRTTLIVSHRVAAVSDADKILFLEDGKIVEEGTHQELLDLGNRYSSLYRRQLLEQEIESL